MPDLPGELSSLWPVLGIAVEAVALLLVPVVLARRKEPPSTVAWILALIFLPGVGATLFLLFGRDRLRIPAQWKRDADMALAGRRRAALDALAPSPSADPVSGPGRVRAAGEAALARVAPPLDRELFRVGAALAGVEPTAGNAVELLVDGEAAYAAIGAAIDAATRTVHAEYYLIRSDATADWLRDRLVAAAARGVDVKLLVDGYGSFWLRRRWLRALRRAGVKVAVFLPARLIFFQPMNLRNHRKIVVVDGEIGFTGGINVGDEYRGRLGPWRDTHLRLEGPSAARLESVFEQDWHFATGEHLPHLDDPGPDDPAPPPSPGEEPGGAAPPARGAIVTVVRSGPDLEGGEREAIHRVFFSAITLARARVYITTPYFLPDRSIVVALQTAALRGVDVRLLFPGRSNHKVVWLAGRSFYEDLLEAGVAIYEYGPGMIHAKTMVVDGGVALVGSANMDMRSFRLNFEVHTVIRDHGTARRLEGCFEADIAVSRRIDLDGFRRRPAALKVLEGAARLLSPLM